jgi:hypothetical protein
MMPHLAGSGLARHLCRITAVAAAAATTAGAAGPPSEALAGNNG